MRTALNRLGVLIAVCFSLFSVGCESTAPTPHEQQQGAITKADSAAPEAAPDPDRPPPELPMNAMVLGKYSDLKLRFVADRDGLISNVTVFKASQAKLFDETAREWVATHWKMPPAKPAEPDQRVFIAPIVFPHSQWPASGHYPARRIQAGLRAGVFRG